MRFYAGAILAKENGVEHVRGWYLDVWKWTLLIWKENQWARWSVEFFRCDE